MSSRALRKALRQKESASIDHLDDSDHDEVEETIIKPKQSAFAMLSQDESDEDESGNDGEQQEEDTELDQRRDRTVDKAQAEHKKDTNKKKKKKKKPKVSPKVGQESKLKNDEQLDEIDAALKQLSSAQHSKTTNDITGVSDNIKSDETYRLLAVDRTNLHAQNEMRKLFGRAAVEHQDENADQNAEVAAAAGGNRRQQRRVQQGGLAQALRGQRAQGGRSNGIAQIGLRRNLFIQGKEEWPAATGGGLGMEIVEKRADGVVEYRYVHSRIYQDVQAQFEACVASMDPNRMVVLLQHNPYHISTLLQVSEIAKSERDHTTSGDLLERALFSLGRAVHSTFAKNLAEGKARLDFRRPENRELWLASWRYMQNLSMRGTWRTVYEWAKLLLALSPHDDPYAIWLILDQYALKSRQDLDYLNLSRDMTLKTVHESMPNVHLSQGLAEYRSGDKSKGQQTLYTAISQYPWFVARLLQELDMDAPPAIWGKSPRTDKEKLYAELYAVRAKDLWNTPEHTALLLETASAIPPEAKAAPAITENINVNEARHTILSDTPALIALVPRKFTSNLTSVSDPLPPEKNIISYETQTMSRAGGLVAEDFTADLRELRSLGGFFRTIFPWLNGDRTEPGQEAEGALVPEDIDAEMMQRMLQTGLDSDEVMRRLTRIQDLIATHGLEGLDNAEVDHNDHNVADAVANQLSIEERPSHQASVEDVADEDD